MALTPQEEQTLKALVARESRRGLIQAIEGLDDTSIRDAIITQLSGPITVTIDWNDLHTILFAVGQMDLGIHLVPIAKAVVAALATRNSSLVALLLAEHMAVRQNYRNAGLPV